MLTSIWNFKDQSTWRLLGLGVITYGVYFAHYVKKQTERINKEVAPDMALPPAFANFILVVSYLSLALFFAYMVLDEQHPIAQLSNLVDLVSSISLLVWGFMARNRLNKHYGFSSDSSNWFHGLWTFLFSPLYFNYKVNCICDGLEEEQSK